MRYWIPVLLSCVAGLVCLYVAVVSAGMGHGSYVWAGIFFPYTMLSTRFFGSITPPFVMLAIGQFPAYGFILGSANVKGRMVRTALVLLAVHLLTIGILWGAALHTPTSYTFLEAIRTGDARTVGHMLNDGTDPNTRNSSDCSALTLACQDGQVEIANLLIAKGADINYQDRFLGDTPLISAVLLGQEQCVQLLLLNGADTQLKDKNGHTALFWARQCKNAKIILLLEAAERDRK